ncbi:MAG: TIR domain-containing protein [Tissierellales bacterium]|nr:TIR domain-containing protein [Tissierellales bacterium]
MPRVFISYVRENQKIIERLVSSLEKHGIDTWFDKEQIKPGDRWKSSIKEGISKGDFYLACFSSEYQERAQTYMNEELNIAVDELRRKPKNRKWFIPVLLNDCEIPDWNIGAGETFKSIHWVELYKDWDAGILQLVDAITADSRSLLLGNPKDTIDFLNAITVSLSAMGGIDAVGEILVQRCSELIGSEGCNLYLVSKNRINLTNSNYITKKITENYEIKVGPNCGLTNFVAATGNQLILNNMDHLRHIAWDPNTKQYEGLPSKQLQSILVIPIFSKFKDIIGVIEILNKKRHGKSVNFSNEDYDTIVAVSEEFAKTLDVMECIEKSSSWIMQGLEDDFHELINYYHSGVVLFLESLAEYLKRDEVDKVRELVPLIQENARRTVEELKLIHTSLATKYLNEPNIDIALKNIVDSWKYRIVNHDLPIEVSCMIDGIVPSSIRYVFLRIASSAISNSILHSGILDSPNCEIKISFFHNSNQTKMTIRDNGVGSKDIIPGYGITRMRQIASQLSKQENLPVDFSIQSSENTGTVVEVCAKYDSD